MLDLFLALYTLPSSTSLSIISSTSSSSSGRHRAGWGLDEPCEDFLKDYNTIKEVKKTNKKDSSGAVNHHHAPDADKPRLFGVSHVKDYEDLVGLE